MENESRVTLLYDVQDKPPVMEGLLLSFQHVFAMFGATILVPLILGLSVSTALLASGLGTLCYLTITRSQVPVYLGSSFAYITAMAYTIKAMDGDLSGAQTGIMLVGFIYILASLLISKIGVGWIETLLPPIVIGPMIIVIGLGLAGTAVENAGFIHEGDWRQMVVALITFMVSVTIHTRGKGFIQVIPFLIAMIVGYIAAIFFGLVDFTPIRETAWLKLPDFSLPFAHSYVTGKPYHFYFGPEALSIMPIALVTIAEHIGDHMVLGEITGHSYIKKPGLHRTLLGDGVATLLSAFIGGPANTTYGENTGVIGLTRIASVSVIRNAAFIAIALSFFGKFTALIATIPAAVLGGMSILLYGIIASNGLKVLIRARVDFNHSRNLVIASAMLVLGLGNAVVEVGSLVISGTALAALAGIILNLILPPVQTDNLEG